MGPTKRDIAVGAGVGTAVGLGLLTGGLVPVLGLLGFGSSGVAAGSTAAAVHSAIGPTIAAKAAGGLFAAAQAIGATGAVSAAPAGAAVAFSTIGGTAAGVAAGTSTYAGRQA